VVHRLYLFERGAVCKGFFTTESRAPLVLFFIFFEPDDVCCGSLAAVAVRQRHVRLPYQSRLFAETAQLNLGNLPIPVFSIAF
jgi:hypothetical protein